MAAILPMYLHPQVVLAGQLFLAGDDTRAAQAAAEIARVLQSNMPLRRRGLLNEGAAAVTVEFMAEVAEVIAVTASAAAGAAAAEIAK